MNFTIRGEKIDLTDSIKEYVIQKISKIEKYFDNPEIVNVKVLFKVRGREQRIEITVNSNVYDLRAEVSHSDMYAAVDLALDKLESQIKKHKSKLMSRDRVTIVYDDDFVEDEPLEEVAKRKKLYLKPMDEEEAIVQMELLGHSFYIYKNIDDSSVCVLYKRFDGTYGVIETN